jgi:hypothetical protein
MSDAHYNQKPLKAKQEKMPCLRSRSVIYDLSAWRTHPDIIQARRPFVLVLIDADAEGFLVRHIELSRAFFDTNDFQFQDKYLTKKAQGGEALADELMLRIREYLRPQFEDADGIDVIVRVYSNLEGMANYLVKLDKVRNLGQLRAFSTGFCGRVSSFDWIDTGVGKEGGSGRKVRGTYSAPVQVGDIITYLSQKTFPSTHQTATYDTSSSPAHLSISLLPSYPPFLSTKLP